MARSLRIDGSLLPRLTIIGLLLLPFSLQHSIAWAKEKAPGGLHHHGGVRARQSFLHRLHGRMLGLHRH